MLLPLTAGATGALNLCQSERNSLITAAGTGMLVAASLSLPAAVIGMGLATGKWDMITSAVSILSLLIVAYAQRTGNSDMSDSEVKYILSQRIIAAIKKHNKAATPLVDLTIFPQSAGKSSQSQGT